MTTTGQWPHGGEEVTALIGRLVPDPSGQVPEDLGDLLPQDSSDVMVQVSLRMKTSTYEQMKAIAAERGLAPSTQLREWAEAQVAAHLSGDDGGTLPFKPMLEFMLSHRLAS